MAKRKPKPICSICAKPIPKKGSWAFGNNAEPINDGRCCDDCDSKVVIPHRIALMMRAASRGK